MRVWSQNLLALLMLLTMGAAGVPALAQHDPDNIAHRCVQNIEDRADEGINLIEEVCRNTLEGIADALGRGDQAGAEAIAQEGINRTNQIARVVNSRNALEAMRCIRVLRWLGADPELIAMVRQAAEDAMVAVNAARDACQQEIRDALGR